MNKPNYSSVHGPVSVAAVLIASASTAALCAPTVAIPEAGNQKIEHAIGSEPNANRGFTDCDGNGIDDAIDRADDRASLGNFIPSFKPPCVRYDFDTVGSDFDTEIALFDEQGTLLGSNDDLAPGVLQSSLSLMLDEPGLYYLAVTGFNMAFADGFSVEPFNGCPAAGSAEVHLTVLNQTNFPNLVPIGSGRVAWFVFQVSGNFETDFDNDGVCDPLQVDGDFAQRLDLGVVARPGDPITLDTAGSSFANRLAVYAEDGTLIQLTDDNDLTLSLEAGTYFAGFAADGTLFADGPEAFFLQGLGGDLALSISSPLRSIVQTGNVGIGRSRWYEFSVAPDVGPDCDFDGVVDADELDCNSDGIPDDCQVLENLALGGVAGTSDAPIEINTFGSDFDTEIAVWDYVTGELLAENDDFDGSNNRQSQIVRTYEPGEYLLAISGFNTVFSDFSPDFQFGGITVNASGCAASGSATVTIGENTGSGLGIGSGRVQLVPFTVLPGAQPCNAADLATPFEVLDLADINAFIDGFTSQSPAGDLNDNGIWDLTDIGLFITAFTGGCP